MTALEITLTITLYVSLGLWICQKREWYDSYHDEAGGKGFVNIFAIVFTPLNLLIVIFKEFILKKWDN